ncbi:hypothetical protein [Bacteroides acidifaciens]|uniref:hypothetical protein n=1 Tax=Bacteroides acidifaciens TaxID=85831 RepID=UPI0025AE0628|nr:hypothetical protein [Bacteroides acidifaciens]
MYIPQNIALDADRPRLMQAVLNSAGIGSSPLIASQMATLADAGATRQEKLLAQQSIGTQVLANKEWRNSFVDIANRIGKVVVQSRLYRNNWASFKQGYMELGDTVEEVYIKLLEAHDFDPERAENEVFKREIPEVLSVFHSVNFRKFYKITISMVELRAAFVTWDGLYNLIGKVIEQMYTSANYDEFLVMKFVVSKAIVDGMAYLIEIPTPTADNANMITTTMVEASNNLTFMNGEYNPMGVDTYTDKSSQITILNTKYAALQNVEVLAKAFNMDKAELEGNVIMVNSFSFTKTEQKRLKKLISASDYNGFFTETNMNALDSVPAVTVDKFFFMIFDTFYDTEELRNPEGLSWNYWLHTWKILSYSPFANYIAYTTDGAQGTITSVNVIPSEAEVQTGQNQLFTATVKGTGLYSGAVEWSVNSTKSTIDQTGYLKVAMDETATTLTVTATSTYDSTKKANATVTVTKG